MKTGVHQPLVSVISPVYNGERFLSECIDSVIAQTYANWEYIIVNNCSTDKTAEIAENYASKDKRIQVSYNTQYYEIIKNWNHAIKQISPQSKYCKVLHSDDILFTECIEKMVELSENNPSVGIVSSYRIDGTKGVHEGGLPYPESVASGKEVGRNSFRRHYYLFGSASTRLIRSDLIRKQKDYYNEKYFHADTAECYKQLQYCDFGFVHQVLSYTRRHNDTQTVSYAQRYKTIRLENYLMLKEYGQFYFNQAELKALIKKAERGHYYFLVKQSLERGARDLYDFHRNRLKPHGFRISRPKFILYFIKWLTAHPIELKKLLNHRGL